MTHYFDNAATTAVCEEAAIASYKAMTEFYGNPSSLHKMGREAKSIVDNARKQISTALGCNPSELIFTSCGSESDNTAIIRGAELMKHKGKHVISSSVEHEAVLQSLKKLEESGYEITLLSPERNGSISPESVKNALRDDTILVSLMTVNNETGGITDIPAISAVLKEAKSHALLHSDAVQGFMKVPIRAKSFGADMISISGHKIHAPKGTGALYVRSGIKIKPYILGGSQENGLRAGTEGVPQIAAFGAAAESAYRDMSSNIERMESIKKIITGGLKAIDSVIVINDEAPHILSISLPGYRSEVIMNVLDAEGVCVSKSSACKKGGRSHVLEAIGLDSRVIDGAIRISLSRFNTEEDAEALINALSKASSTLKHR